MLRSPHIRGGRLDMAVKGIGGIFFRAGDPDGVAAWYRTHLGIGPGCSADPAATPDPWSWTTLGGPVVFAPFAADTQYFPADQPWMLNLRVDALDTMIASLEAGGIAVETRPEWDQSGAGRFARIHDPEGTPIELWEPPA
jgi:predicted enzyme related to lactoylglutathione lyase